MFTMNECTCERMEFVNANLSASQPARRQWKGREYLVVPATLIVSGVRNGSKGPLFYPADEIARNAGDWNGVPVTLRHPETDHGAVSARDPQVLERFELGRVFNASYRDGKLRSELWLDIERTRELAPGILARAESGQPIELSTGLYTDNHRSDGEWNGRRYTHVARNYRPDHLAVFVDGIGACSVNDGCGVNVNGGNRPDPLGLPVWNWDNDDEPAEPQQPVHNTAGRGLPDFNWQAAFEQDVQQRDAQQRQLAREDPISLRKEAQVIESRQANRNSEGPAGGHLGLPVWEW